MPVAIVTDSCHYLPPEMVRERGIHEVSLYVRRGEEAVREGTITDLATYYEQLRSSPELPTTSQPSIGDFLEVYRPLLDAGDDIVSIHLSGGISGTVSAAAQAREALGEQAVRVRVIDSETACGGQGLAVLAACAAARAGLGAEEVGARAREARAALKMWFAIDTLEYLRRGGRIGGAQAWLGTALRIKPILTLEAEITPVERVRTSRRAFERLVDLLRTRHEDGADGWIVQHVQAADEAARLVERGQEIFGSEPTVVSEIGPVIGTHVGPGLLGAGAVPRSLLS